nr:ATP-binding protein [Aneurinibacillus terranovensis]
MRHAKASRIEVKLFMVQHNIHFRISDNGIGFLEGNEKKSSSYGMSLMTERVAEIGGILTISLSPGHGTMIEVIVPLVTT